MPKRRISETQEKKADPFEERQCMICKDRRSERTDAPKYLADVRLAIINDVKTYKKPAVMRDPRQKARVRAIEPTPKGCKVGWACKHCAKDEYLQNETGRVCVGCTGLMLDVAWYMDLENSVFCRECMDETTFLTNLAFSLGVPVSDISDCVRKRCQTSLAAGVDQAEHEYGEERVKDVISSMVKTRTAYSRLREIQTEHDQESKRETLKTNLKRYMPGLDYEDVQGIVETCGTNFTIDGLDVKNAYEFFYWVCKCIRANKDEHEKQMKNAKRQRWSMIHESESEDDEDDDDFGDFDYEGSDADDGDLYGYPTDEQIDD